MIHAARVAALMAVAVVSGGAVPAHVPQPAAARPAGTAAWAVVDWTSGTVIDGERLERLRQPLPPGSLVKLATLVAAFGAGLATPDTRVSCTGEATVRGQLVRCSHPRLRHPLRPAEALAVSCNIWFATIGARVPRARLDGVLAGLGLPPSPAAAPMALAATGLRATASPPLAWVEALARLLRPSPAVPLPGQARAVLLEGLRGAALYGTASAFSERGLDAVAKTGTADAPAGGTVGVVVGAWPAGAPTRAIVLVAPGVAGTDAADLAARLASSAGRSPVPSAARGAAPPAGRSEPPPAGRSAAPPAERSEAPSSARSAEPPTLRVGRPRSAGGYDVQALDLEDYVARVLAGEAAAGSPAAALDALALAVRTFAVANMGRHQREGFDLCTLTHCQVIREPYAAARDAAARTAGQVLLANGALASPYYTASCGGRTERPSAVWPGSEDPEYLPSRRDRACGGEPRWAAEIPVQDLERALLAAGFRGARLRGLDVAGRTSSGRVARVRLDGMSPDVVSGQDLRMMVGRVLGWHLLKSTDFDVRRTGGGYRFDGGGFGHGVGLCVLGSVRRAEGGDSAREIIRAYYPGVTIGRLPAGAWPVTSPASRTAITSTATARSAARPPATAPSVARAPVRTVTLQVPPSAEPERAALAAYAERTLADLARAIGRTPPAVVQVVVHPSADSFRRETGQPWWTAGRTAGARIDLLPLPVLRARGTAESTLRHEFAHLLTAPVLEGRPEWVKEGVAMHFAGEPPPASLLDGAGTPRRVKCPSDDDLRRPVSAAAARAAYGLAAACVARALFEGRDWRDLR